MPALEPTHTSTAPESIAFGIEGYRTRNLGRVVDAMYAPATTFDAWSKRVASTAAPTESTRAEPARMAAMPWRAQYSSCWAMLRCSSRASSSARA